MNAGPVRPEEKECKAARKTLSCRRQGGSRIGRRRSASDGKSYSTFKMETSTMRKLAIALVSALCIGVVGMASAGESKRPSGEIGRKKLATAEVIAIDLPTRTVTL